MGHMASADPACPVCGNTLVSSHCAGRHCHWWVCIRGGCNTIFSATAHMPRLMAAGS